MVFFKTKKIKKKRKKTTYNVYVKVRLAELKNEKPEMAHRARFSQVVKDWKNSEYNSKSDNFNKKSLKKFLKKLIQCSEISSKNI